MFEFYDNLFRFWAIGIMMFLGAVTLRHYWRTHSGILAFASSISGSAYLLCSHGIGDTYASHLMLVLEPFCYMGPLIIWLFGLSLFQDHFKLNRYHIAVSLAYIVLSKLLQYEFHNNEWGLLGPLFIIHGVFRFGLLLHTVYVAWRGWAGDLLETRRRFRTAYVVLVTLASFMIFVVEVLYTPNISVSVLRLIQSVSFAAMSTTIAWIALGPKDGLLAAPQKQGPAKVEAEELTTASDKLDLKTIKKLVVEDELYLEAGLTIARLAQEAKLPEHRLRRLINQHMGYRNFADFLNHYRIDAAKKRLADVDGRHTQVLVIAMDLGYGSLGPFNRAFKERTGQTPTEYRKQALAEIE